jgi:hypothetical protein
LPRLRVVLKMLGVCFGQVSSLPGSFKAALIRTIAKNFIAGSGDIP